MIVLDSTFLILLIDAQAPTPLDPVTQRPIPNGRERIEFLIAEMNKTGERIGIPTPALSEVMVRIPQHIPTLIAELSATYRLKILPFDELAAVEVAMMSDRGGRAGELAHDAHTKAQLKYDRQIIGIAKVNGARVVYSDDRRLCQKARSIGLQAYGLETIVLPPAAAQITLVLPEVPEPEIEPASPPPAPAEAQAMAKVAEEAEAEAAVNPVFPAEPESAAAPDPEPPQKTGPEAV